MSPVDPSKKYVLIADDDASILRFVTAVVESEGLEAVAALASKTHAAGAVSFLPKPFTNHQLSLLLRTFLGTQDKAAV